MEPKEESRAETTLRPVELFIEDLEAMVRILALDGREAALETKDFHFHNLDDLKQHMPPVIHELKLASVDNSDSSRSLFWAAIVVSTYNSSCTITTDRLSDPACAAAYYKLKDFLSNKQRKSRTVPYALLLIGAIGLFIILWLVSGMNPFFSLFVVPALLYLAFWGGSAPYRIKSRIHLIKRHERSTFFSRNKDAIILHVLNTIISASAGAGIVKLVEFFMKGRQ